MGTVRCKCSLGWFVWIHHRKVDDRRAFHCIASSSEYIFSRSVFPVFFPSLCFFVFCLPGENVFGKWKPIWRKIRLKVLAWVICVASFLFQYAVPYFKVICSELSDLWISVKKQTIFHTISKSLIRRGCFEFSVRHANKRYTLWTWNTILLKPFLF